MTTVILISGKQGSGKSTLARGLQGRLGAVCLKFATPLYKMHDAIREIARDYGIPFAAKEGRLLQLLGTEWGRACKGADVWVNALRHKVELHHATDLVVIDDCRFENEVAAFDDMPGVEVLKVRLEASPEVRKVRADGWRDVIDHPSEIGLDHYAGWDIILRTDELIQQEVLDAIAQYWTAADTDTVR